MTVRASTHCCCFRASKSAGPSPADKSLARHKQSAVKRPDGEGGSRHSCYLCSDRLHTSIKSLLQAGHIAARLLRALSQRIEARRAPPVQCGGDPALSAPTIAQRELASPGRRSRQSLLATLDGDHCQARIQRVPRWRWNMQLKKLSLIHI